MPVTVNGISTILADGVRETTQTTGTGTYALDGAATVEGIVYRTFVVAVGNGNSTVYTVRSGSQYEIGIGTVASGAPATLTRSVILQSSNSNNAVNWGVGVKDIVVGCNADVLHSLQAQIGNALTRVKTTAFTGSGTLTPDANMLFCQVRIVGGGGGGGGAITTAAGEASAGGGGGGGEYAEGWFTAAQIGASKTVTIGTGGAGSVGANGGVGVTTNFGSGLMTAMGGSGGIAGTATSSNSVDGGIGGTGGTGGTFRIAGSRGAPGSVRSAVVEQLGFGGASHLSGIQSEIDTGAGVTGQLYGGGGTGGKIGPSSSAVAGGAGAAGVCWVVEYCKA